MHPFHRAPGALFPPTARDLPRHCGAGLFIPSVRQFGERHCLGDCDMNAYEPFPFEDPEEDLHVVEIKVRLRPADARMVQAISDKTRTKRAVVLRRMIVRQLDRLAYGATVEDTLSEDEDSLTARREMRSPV